MGKSLRASGGGMGHGVPVRLTPRRPPVGKWQDALVAECRRESGQGHHGEVQAVHVVLEIEDLRKSGARELLFLPAAVRLLRGNQVIYAGTNLVAAGFTGGNQCQQCPRCLRCCSCALAGQVWIVVAAASFAPAAAWLLHTLEPGDSTPHHWML